MPSYLKFKGNVRCPQSAIIMAACHNARVQLGFPGDTYVTSMNDSVHMRGSFHYLDRAVDFRTRDLTPDQIKRWAAVSQERLGRDYQVLVETDHMHVEHDPKPVKA